jgi:hypothetical protein
MSNPGFASNIFKPSISVETGLLDIGELANPELVSYADLL